MEAGSLLVHDSMSGSGSPSVLAMERTGVDARDADQVLAWLRCSLLLADKGTEACHFLPNVSILCSIMSYDRFRNGASVHVCARVLSLILVQDPVYE